MPWLELTFVAGAAMQLWFYPHCIRPALAFAAARPAAFWLGAATSLLSAISFLALIPVAVIPGAYSLRLPLEFLLAATFGIGAIAYLRPRWIVRATGGSDPTIARRFLLDWLADRWVQYSANDPYRQAAVDQVIRRLVKLGLLDRETMTHDPLVLYMFALQATPDSVPDRRAAVEEELASLRPFDPVSWFQVTRRRGQLAPA